jgi:hypothetical protein
LCLFTSVISHGQEVIASGGNSFSNSEGSTAFTIGQPVIETLENSSNFATQGFHQTQLQVTEIEETFTSYEASIFPNPTQSHVEVQISNLNDDLNIKVFDVSGKLIMSKPYQKNEISQSLDLSQFESGSYYLKLTGKENTKTYTIIKH